MDRELPSAIPPSIFVFPTERDIQPKAGCQEMVVLECYRFPVGEAYFLILDDIHNPAVSLIDIALADDIVITYRDLGKNSRGEPAMNYAHSVLTLPYGIAILIPSDPGDTESLGQDVFHERSGPISRDDYFGISIPYGLGLMDIKYPVELFLCILFPCGQGSPFSNYRERRCLKKTCNIHNLTFSDRSLRATRRSCSSDMGGHQPGSDRPARCTGSEFLFVPGVNAPVSDSGATLPISKRKISRLETRVKHPRSGARRSSAVSHSCHYKCRNMPRLG